MFLKIKFPTHQAVTHLTVEVVHRLHPQLTQSARIVMVQGKDITPLQAFMVHVQHVAGLVQPKMVKDGAIQSD
jgi:hypothetical protein